LAEGTFVALRIFLIALLGIYPRCPDHDLFPIRIPQEWPGNITPQNILGIFSHVNFIPFNFGYLFTANASVIFEQLIGNILLTLPFGFGLPFLVCVLGRRIFWLALFLAQCLKCYSY